MENIDTNMLIAAIVGFVIGALVVWVISLSRGGSGKEYKKLQAEYDEYRKKVNEHFTKTADAIDHLTQSYKDVFTHLSAGAQSLMSEKALKQQIEKRKDKSVTLAYLIPQEAQSGEASTQDTASSEATQTAPQDKPASTTADADKHDEAQHTQNSIENIKKHIQQSASETQK